MRSENDSGKLQHIKLLKIFFQQGWFLGVEIINLNKLVNIQQNAFLFIFYWKPKIETVKPAKKKFLLFQEKWWFLRVENLPFMNKLYIMSTKQFFVFNV